MIKNFFYIFFTTVISLYYSLSNALAPINQTRIDPRGESILDTGERGTNGILVYVVYFKDLLFSLLWIIVVGSFIYVGYKFVTARGNPEEFKKAWTHVVYIVIGIAVVSSAWGIVSVIAGLDF